MKQQRGIKSSEGKERKNGPIFAVCLGVYIKE